MKTSIIVRNLLVATLLFGATPMLAAPSDSFGLVDSARSNCDRLPKEQADVSSSRRQLVKTLDAVTTQDPEALARIFCSVPRWRVDEKIFFSHSAFVGLTEKNEERFLDLLAAVDPVQVMKMAVATGRTHSNAYRVAVEEQEHRLDQAIRGLSRDEQLIAYLGDVPSADSMPEKDRQRVDPKRRVRDLASDPAIVDNFDRIENSWLLGLQADPSLSAPLFANLVELVQLKVMISRNLHFRGLKADRQTVANEFDRIREARERFGTLPLFKERRTAFLANDEEWDWGKPIFGSEKTLNRLRGQGADLNTVANNDAIGGASTQVLGEIQSSRDLTLILGGHGRASSIDLAGGLDIRELALAFVSRVNAQSAGEGPAILIAMSCEGHDFARGLLDAMHRIDPRAPKPVIIVPNEFGQPFLKYPGDPFLGQDLGLRGDDTSTLSTVFGHSHIETSVYVTDENNVALQVL